jgi:hypothetical protein
MASLLKQQIDNRTSITVEDRIQDLNAHDHTTAPFFDTLETLRTDFSIFTDPTKVGLYSQHVLTNVVLDLYQKISVPVFDSNTEITVNISLVSFIKEICKSKSTFDPNLFFDKNISKFLPSFSFEKDRILSSPPLNCPSSIEEFNKSFPLACHTSSFHYFLHGNKNLGVVETNPLSILTQSISVHTPNVCTKCVTLLTLLYIKRVLTDTLCTVYSFQIFEASKTSRAHALFQEILFLISSYPRYSKFHHTFFVSLLIEPLFFERFDELHTIIEGRICFMKDKEFTPKSSDFPPTTKISETNNGIVYLALYLGKETTSIVDMTLLSLVMQKVWHDRRCKCNYHFFTWKKNVGKKPFHIVDLDAQKLVFSYIPGEK